MTLSSRTLMLSCGFVYLVGILLFFVAIRYEDGGHFTYALDDPYIHLAMSENLAHGHYGINPNEYSSPSSSLLWPFLLVPFAGTGAHIYVPFAWNVLFGSLAAGLIGWWVAKLRATDEGASRLVWWQQLVIALLLISIANVISQTIVGMEHVLQVLLAICCAIGVMEALAEREIPIWCLTAAAVAPMVRYEDLGLTMAVCVALAGQRRWTKGWVVFGLSVAPLAAFSAFLKSKGLPLLPMSVLVKSGTYDSHAGPLRRALGVLRDNVMGDLESRIHYPMIAFLIFFAFMAWRSKSRTRRFVLGGAALLAALHLMIGRFGWFGRYELYAMIFLTMLWVWVVMEIPRFSFYVCAVCLLICAEPYLSIAAKTKAAAEEVYGQQYQMHRFVTEFYHGNYAVNDIGFVSFQRTPGSYVLDVYGLGSVEAARQTVKSTAWLRKITDDHDTKLAMIYPLWFEIPPDWTPLGKLCNASPRSVMIRRCMVFYSTRPDANAVIHEDLERFARTLPDNVIFQLDPTRSEALLETPQEAKTAP